MDLFAYMFCFSNVLQGICLCLFINYGDTILDAHA